MAVRLQNLSCKYLRSGIDLLLPNFEILELHFHYLSLWFQLAGVQCAGKPHFWLNADGTYQEEGQKTVKGKIWDKVILKFIFSSETYISL